jgi:hypothetical protein
VTRGDACISRPATVRETAPSEYEALKPPLRDLLARAAQAERVDFLSTIPKFEVAETEAASEQAVWSGQAGDAAAWAPYGSAHAATG